MSGLDGLMRLEMDVLEVLCEMEMAGSPTVDIAALRELDADLDHQLIEITGELYRIAGKQWNFDSNPQKQEIFYGKVRDGGQNLKIYKRTASGAPSCDADALEKHAGNELVDVFVQYQDIKKISSTYIKSYLGTNETKTKDKKRNNAPPFNDLTGRIHANFRQTGTKTGRFSCSEPNLQNIPRPDTDLGKRIRGLFIADPDEKLIVADWSQIEYRILAQYSGDTRLIQAFRDELDFHQYVASLLLAKPMDEVTKVERTLSKNVNFACIYGAGVDKVAVMSGVTLRQAEEFLGEHKRMLKGVYEFTAGLISAGRRSKPPHVKTMLGRLRRLPDLNSTEYGRRGYAERQLVNAKIQGSAADLCKLSMVRQHELVKADGISMPLRLTVHDELVWSVPTTDVEHGLELVREAMMGRSMAKLLDPVPLVADIKVVDRWAEAK